LTWVLKKNAEFVADFKYVEKKGKKVPAKKVISIKV
jgi:hypothetical protein